MARWSSLCWLCLAVALLVGGELKARTVGREPPEYLKRAVVYQLVLRTFTRDGTFAAAKEMLGHVRSCGVDVVYLTPFVTMDTDADRRGWSPRQIASGFDSPKNPYRIADYDRIDPEYGTDEDFKTFNDRAHELGMKVYMDLVYYHCGPNNVLKTLVPDGFQRTNGVVRTTRYNFPYLNFESKALRAYLIESMRRWIRLGCDGFRCDVGDEVPIDFWVEAADACRKLKGDLVMINEGTKVEWLEKVFDACYAWPWSYATRHWINPKGHGGWDELKPTLAGRMDAIRAYESKVPSQALMLSFLDNHDTANDDGDFRFDRVLPVEAGNALFTLSFLRKGVPLVFNGNEIADNSRSSFFGPVGHPARAARTVDWARACQPDGQKRLTLIRRLSELRHAEPSVAEGTMVWQTSGEKDDVVAFVRGTADGGLFVAANLSGKPREVAYCDVPFATVDPLSSEGVRREGSRLSFGPWGFGVFRLKSVK